MPKSHENFRNALGRLMTDRSYRRSLLKGDASLKDDFNLTDEQVQTIVDLRTHAAVSEAQVKSQCSLCSFDDDE